MSTFQHAGATPETHHDAWSRWHWSELEPSYNLEIWRHEEALQRPCPRGVEFVTCVRLGRKYVTRFPWSGSTRRHA